MKSKYLIIGMLLVSSVTQFCKSSNNIIPISALKNSISPQADKPSNSSTKDINLSHGIETTNLKQSDWYANAIKSIEESEYHIKANAATNTYTAPNRQHNLRSSFTPNTFTLQPKKDSTDIWQLTLKTEGIYANDQMVFRTADNTEVTENEATIRFNHAGNFTTEYVNNEQGVRQNFIIHKNPFDSIAQADSQFISVKLSTNPDWIVNKVLDKEIHFAKQEGDAINNKITYNDLKVWDANHKLLKAYFEVNGDDVSIVTDAANAIYPITIDPLSSAPNTTLEYPAGVDSRFGYSVASAGDINGDGYSDVIVGVPRYENGTPSEGAAFIYHGSATGIATAPNTIIEINKHSAEFGWCVASAGDINGDGYSDVVVSTGYSSTGFLYGGPHEGGAFVYYGSATGINTATATWLRANQAYAHFGYSVSSAGDVNEDGYSDIIVGAPYYNNGQQVEGVAFVYHGSATGINTTSAILLEHNQAFANFGFSVASAGDLNGDGYSDIVIGAPEADVNFTDEGVARVFYGSATGIIYDYTFLLCNQAGANLGVSVAGAGDVNGDGYGDLVIGANRYDANSNQGNEGAAFIYHGQSSGINTSPAIILQINQIEGNMGYSVASAGDINGDGYADVVVGAPDIGQSDVGDVYVYHGGAAGLSNNNYITRNTGEGGARFGYSVASAGDVNGDGHSDILVGAWKSGGAGRAYIYHSSTKSTNTTANVVKESNQTDAQMGLSQRNVDVCLQPCQFGAILN